MAQWVIQVRFSLEGSTGSNQFVEQAQAATLTIKKQCPALKWIDSYATFGEYDLLLIAECDDPAQVQKAAMVFRAQGHTETRAMCAMSWQEFLHRL